jgi:YD repeat-containing protein
MTDQHPEPEPSFSVTTFQYDPEGRLVRVEAPAPPGSTWEHDEPKRVFRVTDPDGKVTEFHDRPVRFLVVVPDPRTGKVGPVISWGVPKVMYLCREAGL